MSSPAFRIKNTTIGRMSAQVESDFPSFILHYDIVIYMEAKEDEKS